MPAFEIFGFVAGAFEVFRFVDGTLDALEFVASILKAKNVRAVVAISLCQNVLAVTSDTIEFVKVRKFV